MDDFKLEKVEVATIDSTKAYIVNVEVGNTPKDVVEKLCTRVRDKLIEMGFQQFIIMPCQNGVGMMTFTEIKNHPGYLFYNNDVEIKGE